MISGRYNHSICETPNMATTRLHFTPMRLADLTAVDELEQLCFPTPWPISTYQHELRHNRLGHYWVIRPAVAQTDAAYPPVVAYGGYWLMGDEAHIVTLATHPQWRRRHLGEWILLEMLAQARTQGASVATLEVRPSNSTAQALYHKLDFVRVGVRRRYYRDTGEDALLLTLPQLDGEAVWRPLAHRLAHLRETVTQSK